MAMYLKDNKKVLFSHIRNLMFNSQEQPYRNWSGVKALHLVVVCATDGQNSSHVKTFPLIHQTISRENNDFKSLHSR